MAICIAQLNWKLFLNVCVWEGQVGLNGNKSSVKKQLHYKISGQTKAPTPVLSSYPTVGVGNSELMFYS